MSITRRILFGAAAGWFSRGVTILMGLVLLPVLFRNLPKEELGVWLLLGQTLAGAAVLDLGFSATLTRRIAFAKGKSGSDPNVKLSDETLHEIARLVTTGRRIYATLAIVALGLAWLIGVFFLRRLDYTELSPSTAILAWTILCISQALLLWATIWTCLLQGVGYIGWEAVLATFANAGTLLCQLVIALLGGGLIALAIAAAVGSLSQRFLVLGFTRRKRPELFALHGTWDSAAFHSMLGPSFRAWLTAWGVFMVNYSDQFFISTMEGVKEIPAYRAAFVLVHNVTICAVAFGVASAVFVSHLWQAKQLQELHRVVIRNARLGLLLMLAAAGVLTVSGENVFHVWLGAGNFIGYPILLLFLSSEVLAAQSYIITTASRATEDEAFAFSAVTAGILKLALAFILLPTLGLLGLALATAVALLCTNHWYMVRRGLRRLKIPARDYLRDVVMPCGTFLLITLAVLWPVSRAVDHLGDIAQISIVGIVGGVILTVAIWFLVLEPAQRSRLVRWTGLVPS